MQLPHFLATIAAGFTIFQTQCTVLAQVSGPMSGLPNCAVSSPIISTPLLTHIDIEHEPSLLGQKPCPVSEAAHRQTLPAFAMPQTYGRISYTNSQKETTMYAAQLIVSVRPLSPFQPPLQVPR